MVSGLGGRPSRELGVKARIDLVGIEQVLARTGPRRRSPPGRRWPCGSGSTSIDLPTGSRHLRRDISARPSAPFCWPIWPVKMSPGEPTVRRLEDAAPTPNADQRARLAAALGISAAASGVGVPK